MDAIYKDRVQNVFSNPLITQVSINIHLFWLTPKDDTSVLKCGDWTGS